MYEPPSRRVSRESLGDWALKDTLAHRALQIGCTEAELIYALLQDRKRLMDQLYECLSSRPLLSSYIAMTSDSFAQNELLDQTCSTVAPTDWCWDPMPKVDGWFAVVVGWEPEEGVFAKVVYANAGRVEWPGSSGMTCDGSGYAGPFATRAEAQAWADAHDPEGLR
jgi:hypothetical protein